MSDHFEIMPEYLGALELELRARAGSAAQPRREPIRVRRPALAVLFAALLLVPTLLLAGTLGDATRAYSRPPILDTPSFRIADKLDLPEIRAAGQPLHLHFTEGRRIAAVPGALLLTGENTWCVSAPDMAAREPFVERGMTCATDEQFAKFGLSIKVGHQYLVVLPAGVRAPTLTRGGVTATLKPDEQGVVAIGDFHRGDTVTLYSPDGKERADHAA